MSQDPQWRIRWPFTPCIRHVLVIVIVTALAIASGCDGCDDWERSTRKTSYQEPHIRTPLPGGGIFITERPIIPEHQRANCHVCPEWCKQADLRPMPIDTIIDTYRRHALIDADRTEPHPWPNGWATLEQLACIVAGGSPPIKQRFAELLHDPDPAIRWPSAVHSLQYSIDEPAALAALRAMVGRVLDDGTADGPDGPDYASRAHFLLIQQQSGGPIELP